MTREKNGGRQKGTPNKITRELREVLKNILYQEYQNLPEMLDKLDARSRLEMINKLSRFVLPTVVSVSSNHDEPFDSIF